MTRAFRAQAPVRSQAAPAHDADFRFYVGVHHPSLAWPLTLRGFRVCLSANVLAEQDVAEPSWAATSRG